MDKLGFLIFQMSEHANTAISKGVSYFGFAGVGGGAAIWATEKGRGAVEVATESVGMTIADWAGIVSIVAGVTLILQRVVDVYFTSRADKRKEAELQLKVAEARLKQKCEVEEDGK